MGGADKSLGKSGDGRAARLAEALRENLRRRKTQARARREAAPGPAAEKAGGAAPATDGAGPAAEGRNNGRDATDVPRD